MKKVISARKYKKRIRLTTILLSSMLALTSCGINAREINGEEAYEIETIDIKPTAIPEDITIEIVEDHPMEETKAQVEIEDKEVVEVSKENPEEINEENEMEETPIEEIEETQERKVVALTFDDGPSKYTSELVDILEENNAKATFFVIGVNIPANQDGMIKAYEAGQEIAIHTYSHTSFTKMTIEEIQNELDLTRSMMEELGVYPVNLVRPPYGSINDEIKNNIDTSFILWSVDTRDWESRNVEAIKQEVYSAISEGDIILFHDVYPTTIEAVKQLLPELSEEYEFVSVTELYRRNGIELEDNTKYFKVR